MQALPEALAAGLPSGAIRLETPVPERMRDEGQQVLGVRTPHGEMRGAAVVLAADGDSTARLTGLDVPRIGLGSATLYLAGQQPLYSQKLLALNALADAFVNDATLLTNVVPTVWTTAPSKHVLEPT
jgi:glycine/D-amino acid oxidase-like deaminating enzyme